MSRLMSLMLPFIIGKLLGGARHEGETAGMSLRLPMLMLRKVLQLFMVGFGSLLVGVIGIGFLVRDITIQLADESQVAFSTSILVSLIVAVIGFGACAAVFRKKNWIETEDFIVREPEMVSAKSSQPPDFMTSLLAMLGEFLKAREGRQKNYGTRTEAQFN